MIKKKVINSVVIQKVVVKWNCIKFTKFQIMLLLFDLEILNEVSVIRFLKLIPGGTVVTDLPKSMVMTWTFFLYKSLLDRGQGVVVREAGWWLSGEQGCWLYDTGVVLRPVPPCALSAGRAAQTGLSQFEKTLQIPSLFSLWMS